MASPRLSLVSRGLGPHGSLPMLPIKDCQFSAIDFESAGATDGRTDQPVQIGMASWSAARGHHAAFVSYLHASGPIHWRAQKVHGIRSEDLADAPPLLTLWPQVKQQLHGAIVVAHGKGTEKRFLRAFPNHGFGPWVDTLLLARAVWPELRDHSLGALCRELHLEELISQQVPDRSWHDALYDSVASLALLEVVIDIHQLLDHPVECLFAPDQSAWHRARQI